MTNRPGSLDMLGDSADGLYVVDHRQRIVQWNHGAQQLLGHTADDVLGCLCHEVIAGCGRRGEPICGTDCPVQRSTRRGELPDSVEMHARTKDGQRVWVRVSVIVIPHEPGSLKAHLLHDVSDRRHSAEAMAEIAAILHGEDRARPLQAAVGVDMTAGDAPAERLTLREREVLRLVATGLRTSAIALRLRVSTCTVRNHVQHILTKLDAHSRAEAVSIALRGRLV